MYITDSILVLEKLSIEKKTDVPHQKNIADSFCRTLLHTLNFYVHHLHEGCIIALKFSFF